MSVYLRKLACRVGLHAWMWREPLRLHMCRDCFRLS